MKTFDEIVEAVRDYPVRKVAVACADDASVLEAVREARRLRIAEAVLIGDARRIQEVAREAGMDLPPGTVVDIADDIEAARQAVAMVSRGDAEIVMKGYLHTDDFLRAVLDRESGLRAGVLMSHVFVCELRDQDRLLLITDSAMNIAPDLEAKAEVALNAVHLAHILGIDCPKVAVLAAVELLNPAMPATIDATCLHTMSERRQFSPPCIVDGPFAFDNAISVVAAQHKGITGEVAGQADVMLVPDIEAGNILVKSFVYLAGGRIAGVIVGASAPVVLTSRADSADAKLMSIALAVYMSNAKRTLKLKIGKVHY